MNVTQMEPLSGQILVKRKSQSDDSGFVYQNDVEGDFFEAEVISMGEGYYEGEVFVTLPDKLKAGDVVVCRNYRGIEMKEGEDRYYFISFNNLVAKMKG